MSEEESDFEALQSGELNQQIEVEEIFIRPKISMFQHATANLAE